MGYTKKRWGNLMTPEVPYFTDEYDDSHVSFRTLERPIDLLKRIDAFHDAGKEVLGLDLMGRGIEGANYGCDTTLALTLDSDTKEADEELEWRENSLGLDINFGDIFDKKDWDDFLVKVDKEIEEGKELGLVFFRPWGGMSNYETNTFSHFYLYENVMVPLYNRLSEGGVMFVELLHVPDKHIDYLIKHLEGKKIDVTSNRPLKTIKIEKKANSRESLPRVDANKI